MWDLEIAIWDFIHYVQSIFVKGEKHVRYLWYL